MSEPRIRMLDELGAELARVAARRERRAWRRLAALGPLARGALAVLAVAAVLAGVGLAVLPARDSVQQTSGQGAPSFAAWVLGGDPADAPGRAVTAEDKLPRGFVEDGERRVIAEAGGQLLYVQREDIGGVHGISFGLGHGAGVQHYNFDWWRRRIEGRDVYVLGSTPIGRGGKILDDRGRFALFGVASERVERLELRYDSGPPLVEEGVGDGFVLLADGGRRLSKLLAYDAEGKLVDRADVSSFRHIKQCREEPSCTVRDAGRSKG